MTFARRKLRVTVGIGKGKNGEEGQDNYTLPDGLRIRAHVDKVGGYTMGRAELQISGLTLDLMNKLSSLGLSIVRLRTNSVRIEASDDHGGMATVFQGTIDEGGRISAMRRTSCCGCPPSRGCGSPCCRSRRHPSKVPPTP